LDRTHQDAYLARLGLEAEPPSVDALFRLHRAQVERVPYETVWIHLGEQWTVDADASVRRVATDRRGGYCFHLNGALSELLRALGYDVVRHVGGVHGPDGASEAEMTNHLVLTVKGLPTAENPDGTWYVDAGLGDDGRAGGPQTLQGRIDVIDVHPVREPLLVGAGTDPDARRPAFHGDEARLTLRWELVGLGEPELLVEAPGRRQVAHADHRKGVVGHAPQLHAASSTFTTSSRSAMTSSRSS